MKRPLLLDLFCGAGGAGMGYYQAGFDVIGVDIKPQPRYPFEFVRDDALEAFADLLDGRPIGGATGFAAVHASPTCQTRSRATAWRGRRDDHPDLLTPTLRLLQAVAIPWVVENVPEAVWDGTMRGDLMLCGTHFALPIKRHRAFQFGNWSSFTLLPPTCPANCYRNPRVLAFMHKGERAYADAMGCTWMSKFEARQAIPPAYTQFIGEQLLSHVGAVTP